MTTLQPKHLCETWPQPLRDTLAEACKGLPADIAAILSQREPNELGVGHADQQSAATLETFARTFLDSAGRGDDGQMPAARAAVAGLWLRCDFLAAGHTIVQELADRQGAFWHGIMHRREGDFSNAKYWMRRVANDHPVHARLGACAAELAASVDDSRAAAFRGGAWSSAGFIDVCALAVSKKGGPLVQLCRQIQLCEWQLLFAWSRGQATTA